jgi:uncharacterized membrane protein
MEGEEKKELKAKTVSLVAKITGAAIVLIGAVLKWVGVFSSCEINELCVVGFTIMGIFGTVDLNLLADKFTSSGRMN